ncbi:prohibitin family protein [Lebetimonas sp. JH292]|uniref:prohibitin family protein n=1 Tax=Lebetimonas sp. JH292 TaxID=990068 RepID=UPI0004645E02|nr:prohibitin family protein [Lebetimonas sp. JH292]
MPADLNDWMNKNNNKKPSFEPPKFEPPKFIKGGSGLALIIIGIIIVFGILFRPWIIVNEGEIGILATTGKFSKEPLYPGMHFYVPVIQKVIIVDTKVHMISYKRIQEAGTMPDRYGTIKVYPAINVLDARGLPITVELSVSYRINPDEAAYTIKTYGLNWEDKIINPIVRDVVRNVIGKYPAEDLPVKRNEIAMQIETQIRDTLNKIDHKPVIFESFQLRDIVLPENIRKQIERVQIAKQESERAKYEVLRAEQEAQKQAAIAQGKANAAKIEAQGKADAKLIEASAEAKANIIISKSLTNNLLKLKEIEVQGKFNEALKANPNAKIFLTPGGAVPNIWMNIDDKKKALSNGK